MKTAVFIFGSAGSGKTTLAHKMFDGFIIIDSDDGFNHYIKKWKLSPKITDDPIYKEARHKGGDLIIRLRDIAVNQGKDVALITTGYQYDKIVEYNQKLVNLGYDIRYIWVKISKEIALLRNNQRDRVLPEHIFNDVWDKCEINMEKLQKQFPICIYDNS